MEKRKMNVDRTIVIRRRGGVPSGTSISMSAALNALCPPKKKNIQKSPNCGGGRRNARRHRNGKK